jgi:hypothetical protein
MVFFAVFLFSFVNRSIKVTDPLRDSLLDALQTSLCVSRSVLFFWLRVGLLCMMVTVTLCLD